MKILIRFFWFRADMIPHDSHEADFRDAEELIRDWLTRNPLGKVDFIKI